jgi:hypothetical protein
MIETHVGRIPVDPMSEAALRRARLALVYVILGALNALVVYVLLQI